MPEDNINRDHRPRTTYRIREKVIELANEIDESDDSGRGFHEALVILVEYLDGEWEE